MEGALGAARRANTTSRRIVRALYCSHRTVLEYRTNCDLVRTRPSLMGLMVLIGLMVLMVLMQ